GRRARFAAREPRGQGRARRSDEAMSRDFQRRMGEAARLMRSGSLMEATAAIQQALGGHAPESTASAGVDEPDVIDVEVRVVDTDAPTEAAAAVARESFTSGHYRNEAGAR